MVDSYSGEIKENIVIYDWLSFTSKTHTPEQLVEVLGLTHCPWTDLKGARGYRDRRYFGSISIHYNGREDMGVWVEMSGQGCRSFESFSDVGWDALFQFIHHNGLKITRLDVAYDDHTGILDLNDIVSDTQSGLFVSRSEWWETILSCEGTCVMIGSPQSKVRIRIYDKARERHCPEGEHWVRVEMQLRDDRAIQFTKIPLTIGEGFAGVLLNYLRYIEPAEDANRWRWPMRGYWLALVGDAEKISIYCTPGIDYNEDRVKRYVVNQAGNAIDCCIQMYGINEFVHMIKNRPVAPNPKYEAVVKEYRFEELAQRVNRLFGTVK